MLDSLRSDIPETPPPSPPFLPPLKARFPGQSLWTAHVRPPGAALSSMSRFAVSAGCSAPFESTFPGGGGNPRGRSSSSSWPSSMAGGGGNPPPNGTRAGGGGSPAGSPSSSSSPSPSPTPTPATPSSASGAGGGGAGATAGTGLSSLSIIDSWPDGQSRLTTNGSPREDSQVFAPPACRIASLNELERSYSDDMSEEMRIGIGVPVTRRRYQSEHVGALWRVQESRREPGARRVRAPHRRRVVVGEAPTRRPREALGWHQPSLSPSACSATSAASPVLAAAQRRSSRLHLLLRGGRLSLRCHSARRAPPFQSRPPRPPPRRRRRPSSWPSSSLPLRAQLSIRRPSAA